MSTFLRSKLFETTFDGDTVKVHLKPIVQADALKIFAHRDDDRSAQNIKLLPVFSEMLPRYVDGPIEGLRAADGSNVTVDELTTHMYFSSLVMELGYGLAAAGRIPDPKASGSPPAEPSQA